VANLSSPGSGVSIISQSLEVDAIGVLDDKEISCVLNTLHLGFHKHIQIRYFDLTSLILKFGLEFLLGKSYDHLDVSTLV
jgi:hypothetical protein